MRRISMAVLTGLLGCSALAAAAAVPPTAVPTSPVPQSVTVQTDVPWLPAAAAAKPAGADPLESLFPNQQVCLCALGNHCCIVHGKQTCIPNSQPCP
jgi:hypothetical protein